MKLPEGFQAAIFTSPSNMFYLTGYSNADAAVAVMNDTAYYVTDKRCLNEAVKLLGGFETVDCRSSSYVGAAAEILKERGAVSVGVEKDKILYKDYAQIAENFDDIIDISGFIGELRSVKTYDELKKIKAAQKITDTVFSKVIDRIKEGMTEMQLKTELDSLIVSAGAVPAFDSIVAFGENTALPHAHAGDRKLKYGDAITLDFGAKLNGYCSDMTRSLAFGHTCDEYRSVYNAVLGAKNNAESLIKAGMTGRECDLTAREYLAARGLDAYFTHSLGHSLGIDIHETPNLSPRSEEIIPEGAVTSVEPGIYLDGKFGIRIEDTVVFKKTGVDNLTNSPEQLIIL